mgnify:CR=1 FL=1
MKRLVTLEQYQETKVDNWSCIVSDLNPISELGK